MRTLAAWCAVGLSVWSLACSNAPPAKPAPASDPQLVVLGVEPTAERVLADTAAALAVRIRISAARLPKTERPPLNLTLVIDTSGSMEGAAIASARDAAKAMIERLAPGDRVSVVTFSSMAEVLVPSTEIGVAGIAKVLVPLARIQARGTTDLASGLARGLEQARLGRRPGSIDRIVLLGDGVPNDPSPIPALVAQAQAEHLPIATLGLGLEFDPELLAAIALQTGGQHHYADDPAKVVTLFVDELLEMRQVVGKNLALSITAGPGVALEPMPGFAPVGGGLYASLGDLAAGDVLDVIVPVRIAGHKDGATVELVDARLSFEDAALGAGAFTRLAFASVRADADQDAVTRSIKVDAVRVQARTVAAAAILDAIARARAGDRAAADRILAEAEPATRKAATELDDPELKDLADRMASLRQDLPAIAALATARLDALAPRAGAGGSPAAPSPAAAEALAIDQAEVEQVEHRLRHTNEHANRVLRR